MLSFFLSTGQNECKNSVFCCRRGRLLPNLVQFVPMLEQTKTKNDKKGYFSELGSERARGGGGGGEKGAGVGGGEELNKRGE